MSSPAPVIERLESATGVVIYRIPLEVFPNYIAYSHLLVLKDSYVLVDVGSGFGSSHEDLVRGLSELSSTFHLQVGLQDVSQIIITHGHIDHFGGLGKIKQVAPQARIAIHELARPVLINYDERLLTTSQNLRLFLKRAGVPPERHKALIDMYMLGKRAFKPMSVDCTLRDGDLFSDVIKIIHVPGHEPGLIMLQIADVLLTADHVLPMTSVSLAPESLMPFTGVAHYIESLEKAEAISGIRMALGGHEAYMDDYYEVVRRARLNSLDKIDRVLAELAQPKTIYETSLSIYGNMDGYSELLKLEQTGARIEYLNQRGLATVDNLDALEETDPNVRLLFRRV